MTNDIVAKVRRVRRRKSPGHHGRATAALLGAAAAVVAVERLLFLLMTAILGMSHRWFRWDGSWYLRVAQDGYPLPAPSAWSHLTDLVFFPLYPLLARLVHAVGLPLPAALLMVAWSSTLVAAAGIAACGAELADRRTGILIAALWGAAPRALVTLLPYSEPLFTALAAWCLFLLLRRRWLSAGLLSALAGLTRSTAVTLVATMACVWLVDVIRSRLGRRPGREGLWRGVWATALGASGLAAYLAYAAIRTGHLDGYVRAQRTWNMRMGSPWTIVDDIRDALTRPHAQWWSFQYVAGVVIVTFVLCALLLATRTRTEFTAFACISWLWMAAAQGYFWSRARFLLPIFPLWFLPACLLRRYRPWVSVVVIGLLFLVTGYVDARTWAGTASP